MTEAEKEAVCAWRYPGEYAVYNLPPYALQKAKGAGLGNPANADNYRSYRVGETLIGFTNIRAEADGVFIGVGVHPEKCSCGYGQQIMGLAVAEAQRLYPSKTVYLEVRTWNRRAIRCYEKAGFRRVGTPFTRLTGAGEGEFCRMELVCSDGTKGVQT